MDNSPLIQLEDESTNVEVEVIDTPDLLFNFNPHPLFIDEPLSSTHKSRDLVANIIGCGGGSGKNKAKQPQVASSSTTTTATTTPRLRIQLKNQVLRKNNNSNNKKGSSVCSEEEAEEEEDDDEEELQIRVEDQDEDKSQLVNNNNNNNYKNKNCQPQQIPALNNNNKNKNNLSSNNSNSARVSPLVNHQQNISPKNPTKSSSPNIPQSKSGKSNNSSGSGSNNTDNNNINSNSTSTKNNSSSIGSTMSLFKALTRRNSNQSKHKKFNDNWINGNRDPVLEGVTFYVKFLGSVLTAGCGAEHAADATKTVIQMVKAGKKTSRVGLTVSAKGITLLDAVTGDVSSIISIFDISHCAADGSFPNAFSFIATNKNETNECYCFASRKRKMAQQVTLTIAESFNVAFEIWQNSSGEMSKPHHHQSAVSAAKHLQHFQDWVSFDDEDAADETELELTRINSHFENVNLRSYRTRQDSLEDHHQDLLICLN